MRVVSTSVDRVPTRVLAMTERRICGKWAAVADALGQLAEVISRGEKAQPFPWAANALVGFPHVFCVQPSQFMKNESSNSSGAALITGASSGIGLELAREFARNGHDVVLVAPIQSELDTVA